MTEEQADALANVKATFAEHVVDHEEAADGGLLIIVREVAISDGWNPASIDLAVKLQVTFPSSMPYPFYCAPGLARADGQTFSQVQPNVDIGAGVMRTQISLTVQGQQQFDTVNETLGSRFVAVIAWLRRPR
jgi:Prokaryotic E2 family E